METSIISVIVYPDRARVIRQGQVSVKPGVQQLEISDLPIRLNPDSARIKGHGTARARLLGIRLQKEYYSETPTDHVRELEEQIEAVQDEIERLDAKIELIKGYRTRLDELAGQTKTFAKALMRGALNIDAQMMFFDKLHVRAGELDVEIQSLAQNRRALERRLEKLKNQLEQVSGDRPRQRYVSLVEYDVSQPGELAVEFTYDVSGAGWTPLYDLRLLEDGGKPRVEVSYLAQISQRTGENWNGVSLTLSTARPALTEVSPDLDPWYIRPLPTPSPRRARGIDSVQLAAPAKMVADDEALVEYETENALAEVRDSGTAVSFQVPGKIVVPSDGEPHKVNVARFWLPPNLDYVSAPKVVQAAYIRSQLINDSPNTLLPGSANLFMGDEFIGTTRLDLTPPQGEFELYMGVDDRLKVSRELRQRDVGKKLIGGKRRLHYAYQIKLQNFTGREAAIEVSDQIPLSRHEDIKVKLESVEPQPDEKSELNILTWKLLLEEGQESELRFDFTVEHPAEMRVAGLP